MAMAIAAPFGGELANGRHAIMWRNHPEARMR